MEAKFVLACFLVGALLRADTVGSVRSRGLKPPRLSIDCILPGAQWIDQKLDHYAPRTTYWKQRYFVNATWWDGRGPVFLMLGGEGPASPAWLATDTTIMIMAKKYGALVFSVEHRYYGESHPMEDISLSSLKYLSSRQSLSDFAHFITIMRDSYNLSSSNKWVVFGGSYSGALAAWFRQLYPELAVGAVATSAPVLAKVDFLEYVEVTAASLGTSSYGKTCPQSISDAFLSIDVMLLDKSKWPSLENMFNVKKPLKTFKDTVYLIERLAGLFEGVVQYNRDNLDFRALSTTWKNLGEESMLTIEYLCKFMSNTSLGSSLDRFIELHRTIYEGMPLDADYDALIKSMSDVSWNSTTEMRQWMYQVCTEFAYFQTTNSFKTHIFSKLITLDYYMDICSEVFGISPDDVKTAVNKTNNFYGGRNVTGTNILFPNGSIDQWHALSVTHDLSDSVRAIFINGTAHCADMYPPASDDLEALVLAREKISATVGMWVES